MDLAIDDNDTSYLATLNSISVYDLEELDNFEDFHSIMKNNGQVQVFE